MNELLDFFQEEGVAIQITLDIGKRPTVHALHNGIHRSEHDTIVGALELMKEKLFGAGE